MNPCQLVDYIVSILRNKITCMQRENKLIKGTSNNDEMENWYLVNESGRQILHVTYGSVLVGGMDSKGYPLKDQIMNNLIKNEGLYCEFLQRHLGKHIDLLLSQINMSAH